MIIQFAFPNMQGCLQGKDAPKYACIVKQAGNLGGCAANYPTSEFNALPCCDSKMETQQGKQTVPLSVLVLVLLLPLKPF
jgi:hypothetical protein